MDPISVNKFIIYLFLELQAKPDGVFYLKDNEAEEYFQTVQVSDLPGVGRSNNHKFKAMGIENCAQLQELPIGKNHALKKYDKFALNTCCFW